MEEPKHNHVKMGRIFAPDNNNNIIIMQTSSFLNGKQTQEFFFCMERDPIISRLADLTNNIMMF